MEAVFESQVAAIETMANTDPSECFKMVLCQLSTPDSTLEDSPLEPILDLVQIPQLKELPPRLSEYRQELLKAIDFGALATPTETCEAKFECPIGVKDLNTLVERQIEALQ